MIKIYHSNMVDAVAIESSLLIAMAFFKNTEVGVVDLLIRIFFYLNFYLKFINITGEVI